jgi:type IV pilus assembly protein PilZ
MPKAKVEPVPVSEQEAAQERRQSPRADLLVRVDYQTVDELFSDFARNINEGGMFVETDKPPTVGTEVSLMFRIPGSDEPVVSSGRVVRTAEASGGSPPGMGIEFDTLDQRSRQRINDLVRNLRSVPRKSCG